MKVSNNDTMKRLPNGFLDCLPIFGTANKTKKGNDVDDFKKQDKSFEGQLMTYTQIVGGLFAVFCLGIALISDGENKYDTAVLCLQMFSIAVFFVYFAFLNSTLLYNNSKRDIQVRMLVAFMLAAGFGGYCCVQVSWYSLATQNPVIVQSVVHTDLSNFGTQRLTFMLTPVYEEGVEPELMNAYPVLSLTGMGKNETRMNLTRPDGSSRMRALIGTTDFISEECDKFGDDNKFDMYEYVDCLPLYQEVVSCTTVYTYAGTFTVPRNESIIGFDDSMLADTKKLLAGIWSVATGQVKTKKENSTFTPHFGETEYSFTITACAAMPAQGSSSCMDFSSQCFTICQTNTDFESSTTCFAQCRKISNLVCTQHKFGGMVEMLVLDSTKASDPTFKTTLGSVIQEAFNLDGTADVVVAQDNTHARFEISTYDSNGKTLAESACSSAAVSGHTSLAGIVSISGIQCSLYNLRGTVDLTPSGDWNADADMVKSGLTNFYSATGRTMIEVSPVMDSSSVQDFTKVDFTAYTTSQTEHSDAVGRCNSLANKPQAPVTALTCVDGENPTRRQLHQSTLRRDLQQGSDFGCNDEEGSLQNFDMCRDFMGETGFNHGMCESIYNSGLCVTGHPGAYFCCPQTCGHCDWVTGPKDDSPWEEDAIVTTSRTPVTCSVANTNPITFSMHVDDFPKEMKWVIQTRSGIPASPTCDDGNAYLNSGINSVHDKDCCLPEGEYTAQCNDTARDGWDYGSLSVGSFDGTHTEMHTLCAFTTGEHQMTNFRVTSTGSVEVDSPPVTTSRQPSTTTTGSSEETSYDPNEVIYIDGSPYMKMHYATCESRGWTTVVIEEECNALGKGIEEFFTSMISNELSDHGVTFGGSFQTVLDVRSSTAYPKGCNLDDSEFRATYDEIEEGMMSMMEEGNHGEDADQPDSSGGASQDFSSVCDACQDGPQDAQCQQALLDGCQSGLLSDSACDSCGDFSSPTQQCITDISNDFLPHCSSGTGRRQLNTLFEGRVFNIPLVLNTADSSTMCTEDRLCLCRIDAESQFTTAAPSDDQQVDEVVQANDAAKAALALVEGNAGRSQIYELTLDFKDDDELIQCGERSCRVVNMYFIMSKLGYEYVNFNFWTGSDTENAVSLIQSDRFLRAGYKLQFDQEKFLDQSSKKRVQMAMIQYGEQPDKYAKKWVKVRFLLPAKNGKVPASLAEEKLTYTIGDVWTAIIATSGLAGAMFAFVFPNVLSKSYFRFAPWQPHVEQKVPVLTSTGDFDASVFQSGDLKQFQENIFRKMSAMNYDGKNTGSPAHHNAPACESPGTHNVEVQLTDIKVHSPCE